MTQLEGETVERTNSTGASRYLSPFDILFEELSKMSSLRFSNHLALFRRLSGHGCRRSVHARRGKRAPLLLHVALHHREEKVVVAAAAGTWLTHGRESSAVELRCSLAEEEPPSPLPATIHRRNGEKLMLCSMIFINRRRSRVAEHRRWRRSIIAALLSPWEERSPPSSPPSATHHRKTEGEWRRSCCWPNGTWYAEKSPLLLAPPEQGKAAGSRWSAATGVHRCCCRRLCRGSKRETKMIEADGSKDENRTIGVHC
nr:hypothetical protein Iba_chr14bCG9500 [Ipomoea batatas]GMD86794.1 hypothetical protein Iba_chr14bCG9510 [Ipomoea batatas]